MDLGLPTHLAEPIDQILPTYALNTNPGGEQVELVKILGVEFGGENIELAEQPPLFVHFNNKGRAYIIFSS